MPTGEYHGSRMKEVMLRMEKKVTTSPVVKSSKGMSNVPAGKKSTARRFPPSKSRMDPSRHRPASAAKPHTHHHHDYKHDMKHWCHDHMHRYVLAHTHDGWCCDGFIEHIDDEVVCIAVPYSGARGPRVFPGPVLSAALSVPVLPAAPLLPAGFPSCRAARPVSAALLLSLGGAYCRNRRDEPACPKGRWFWIGLAFLFSL